MKFQILPSLLAADYGRLADGAALAEHAGADALHLDIMDGHFVPNLSFGPDVVAMARKTVSIPLNVHLMLSNPDKYIERFAKAGATTIQIHVESDCNVDATLRAIRACGCRAGLVLNPDTEATAVAPYWSLVDEVLCMTVYPGYGGQKFMERVLPHVEGVRRGAVEAGRPELDVMVDGGVDRDTIVACARAGANAFVAGSSLYRAPDMTAEIALFRERLTAL